LPDVRDGGDGGDGQLDAYSGLATSIEAEDAACPWARRWETIAG
jgi:hypothetical protein